MIVLVVVVLLIVIALEVNHRRRPLLKDVGPRSGVPDRDLQRLLAELGR